MRCRLALVLLAVLVPGGLRAQAAPDGWKVVLDSSARTLAPGAADGGGVQFVAMPPGFHITMGPGGLLYRPGSRADGRFAMEAQIFLFPGTSTAGYGLFMGGTDLDQGRPAYTEFVLRRDGMAAVIRHDGEERTVYLPWARPDSVASPGPDAPAANTFRVVAERDSVTFLVNGRRLGAVERSLAPVDGEFGYRIGAGMNVHATSLDVLHRLAPARP
ncbi:MAG TPA: hypothetical protein VFN83_03185 [Gemmatimonadales bacterium]|jgi:hypothetical protein|nr:hypothetical protein [Gemmatimonadales bacterium]